MSNKAEKTNWGLFYILFFKINLVAKIFKIFFLKVAKVLALISLLLLVILVKKINMQA